MAYLDRLELLHLLQRQVQHLEVDGVCGMVAVREQPLQRGHGAPLDGLPLRLRAEVVVAREAKLGGVVQAQLARQRGAHLWRLRSECCCMICIKNSTASAEHTCGQRCTW